MQCSDLVSPAYTKGSWSTAMDVMEAKGMTAAIGMATMTARVAQRM